MKLSESRLKEIIREEVKSVLSERRSRGKKIYVTSKMPRKSGRELEKWLNDEFKGEMVDFTTIQSGGRGTSWDEEVGTATGFRIQGDSLYIELDGKEEHKVEGGSFNHLG